MTADIQRLGSRLRSNKVLIGFITDSAVLGVMARHQGPLNDEDFPAAAQLATFPLLREPMDLFLSPTAGVSHSIVVLSCTLPQLAVCYSLALPKTNRAGHRIF